MSVIHIQHSIEGVIKYLSEHPDECRSTDSAATAVVEEGLRCCAEGLKGRMVMSAMPLAIGGRRAAALTGRAARAIMFYLDSPPTSMRHATFVVNLCTY